MDEQDQRSSRRAELGDEFAALFARHARQIYAYILTLVPHWADAEDVFQETSSIIWQKFQEFESGTNFRAWACKIAYFRAMWFWQRQKKLDVPFSEEFFQIVAAESLAQQDMLEEQHRALADCVQRLPERDRALLDRCYVGGTTIKQAATELNRTPEAAYKALRRIHRELFDCVDMVTKTRSGS